MSAVKVSKVLHISNITHNISRFDIIDEIERICPVKQVFVLRPNNQALVEMYNSTDAEAVYSQFQSRRLEILGNEVEVKYSRYDQLVRPEDQTAPRCVLLVSIICRDNSTLSLRHFYSICCKHGSVDRIRMFIHQAGPQALVQYSHLYDCIRAKGELEKSTFVQGGRRYSFEVQYSKLKELVIHKNNNYSRDFRLYPLDLDCGALDARAGSSDDSPCPGLRGYPEDLRSASTGSELLERESLSGGSSPLLQEASLRGGLGLLRGSTLEEFGGPLCEEGLRGAGYAVRHGREACGLRRGATELGLQPSLDLWGRGALCRRDSEMSSLSSCSLRTDRTDSMGFDDPFLPTGDLGLESRGMGLFPAGGSMVRKYELEGFGRMVPISDLVDLLYGIDIKYAEYKSEPSGFAVVIFGKSEWSDAMLASYLRSNPVDGRVIRLRGASELVSY